MDREQPNIMIKTLHFHHPRIGKHTLKAAHIDTLSECRNVLEQSTELFLFTNYYFQYKGKRLSEMEPIIEVIPENQVTIDIVFSLFDHRSAKHHLAKVMEILKMPDIYVYIKIENKNDDTFKKELQQRSIPKWASKFDITKMKPDLGSQLLDKTISTNKVIQLLYSISLSGFNPPPVSQQLNGDLFYIHVRTLEPMDVHITASPHGFYVNQSKISNFNPIKSHTFKTVYPNLIDLLRTVSESFRDNLEEIMSSTQLTQSLKYKVVSLGKYRAIQWLQESEPQHGWNNRKNLRDDNIKIDLLSIKDWNEIFQINQKITREGNRTKVQHNAQLAKIYSEFESAAIEGAMCLVDGKISPLNPTDDKKRHIYIYNKIFFSIANQTPYDHSQEKGDDATPSSSSVNTDIINISTLEGLDIPDLHVLHMVVVSYRGYKIIAQGIIPGILSVDQINCSQYGSLDDGKTIETNPDFEKLMLQVCEKLGLYDKVQVTDGQGEVKTIAGSPDIKGILGTDQRKYILDLLRLSPRDLNYEGPQNETCVIRPELLKHFKAMKEEKKQPIAKINVNIGTQLNFIKDENYEQQRKLLQDIADYLKNVAIVNLIETLKNSPSQYLTDNKGISKVFHHWGVNMRYLGRVISHELLKKETHIVLFLKRIILVRSLKHLFRMALRETNVMHLGLAITNLFNGVFGRAAHINLLEQGEKIDLNMTPDSQNYVGDKDGGNIQVKKKKKKKNKDLTAEMEQIQGNTLVNTIKIPVPKFMFMKPSQIWEQVRKLARCRFDYDFQCNSINDLDVFQLPFQKIAALRDLCLSIGIVLEKKDYDITEESSILNDKVFPFTIKNIVNIEAKAKRMKVQPPNLEQREQQSEKFISGFQVKEAFANDQAIQQQNTIIWGGCNEIAVRVNQRRGRVIYILGDYKSATTLQELNLSILESLTCPDSALMIQAHQNLGLYYIGLGEKEKVVYHLKRNIYLMLMAFGETSPDLLVSLVNLAKIYQVNKQYDKAVECYHVGIYFLERIHGKIHIKLSFCYSSLASICYEMADLKKAIEYQTQTVSILLKIFPETDSRLQDAIKILKTYRQMHQNSLTQNPAFMKQPEPPKKPQQDKKKKNPNRK